MTLDINVSNLEATTTSITTQGNSTPAPQPTTPIRRNRPPKMPQKVLVTGASGLIGGLIVTKLEDKYEFSALNRSPLADWK